MPVYTRVKKMLPHGSGMQFCDSATTQKMAFFAASPVSQPSGATQAAVATTAITTAATSTTPFGFATSTQANNLATIVAANRTLLNQIRSDLVTLGLIKGSA